MRLTVCNSGSDGNTYLLNSGDSCIILDCGVNLRKVKRMLDFKVSHIKFVLCSHIHSDHSKYVKDYLDMGVTVYMPPEMKKNYQQNNAVRLKERIRIRDGDFFVTPFYVPHDGTPNYAYIIQCGEHRIAWLTDLEYCPYILKNQNLTEIFCECNYRQELVDRYLPNFEHKIRGHCSLETCKNFIQANKTNALRNVILCHLGAETAIAEECIDEVKKVANCPVYVAEKGLEIELSLYPF